MSARTRRRTRAAAAPAAAPTRAARAASSPSNYTPAVRGLARGRPSHFLSILRRVSLIGIVSLVSLTPHLENLRKESTENKFLKKIHIPTLAYRLSLKSRDCFLYK